jgi:hypothetical protein
MRLRVESAEVQTLQANGKHWDNVGSASIPKEELQGFFSLSLSKQLERLAALGDMPNPPDVMVRIILGDQLVLETNAEESFDPVWPTDEAALEIAPGQQVRIEVYDLDLAFHDLIGITDVSVPEQLVDGCWSLSPFGQVRKLVFRCD